MLATKKKGFSQISTPGYAISKLSEIANCQIRDGLMLPPVNYFLWCIIQQALVVAVQTKLLHMTGET